VAEGELFAIGRLKDIIIIGGQNIFPEDVEAAVNSIPEIYPGRAVAFGSNNAVQDTVSVVIVAELKGVFDPHRALPSGKTDSTPCANSDWYHTTAGSSGSGALDRKEYCREDLPQRDTRKIPFRTKNKGSSYLVASVEPFACGMYLDFSHFRLIREVFRWLLSVIPGRVEAAFH
jgi:acyl-CoA synthetase (AMP-forming)/AMP-acid ligase II